MSLGCCAQYGNGPALTFGLIWASVEKVSKAAALSQTISILKHLHSIIATFLHRIYDVIIVQMRSSIERLEQDYRQQLDRAQERLKDAQEKELALRNALDHRKRDEEQWQMKIEQMQEENEAIRLKSDSFVMVRD